MEMIRNNRIPPTSTKRTITFHLKSLNMKMTMTYDVVNLGQGGRFKPFSGIQSLPIN
jgi:hypothetical protein